MTSSRSFSRLTSPAPLATSHGGIDGSNVMSMSGGACRGRCARGLLLQMAQRCCAKPAAGARVQPARPDFETDPDCEAAPSGARRRGARAHQVGPLRNSSPPAAFEPGVFAVSMGSCSPCLMTCLQPLRLHLCPCSVRTLLPTANSDQQAVPNGHAAPTWRSLKAVIDI